MTRHTMTLSAVYDDATDTLTLSGSAPPPPPPAGFPEWLWTAEGGVSFEVSFPVRRSGSTTPTATYMVPGSNPIERRRVTFEGGAWQMPGEPLVPAGGS